MKESSFSDDVAGKGLVRLFRVHPVDSKDIIDGPVKEVAVRGRYEITDRIGANRQVYLVGIDLAKNVLVYNFVRTENRAMSNTCEAMDLGDIVSFRRLSVAAGF